MTLAAAPAACIGAWTSPVAVSAEATDPVRPVGTSTGLAMAMDPEGVVTAVWSQWLHGDPNTSVFSARMTNGSWSAPASVSSSGADAINPQVAVGTGGDATVAWLRGPNTPNSSVRAIRYSAGRWHGEVELSPAGGHGAAFVASTGPNSAAVAWSDTTSMTGVVRAVRHVEGVWGPTSTISGASTDSYVNGIVAGAPGQVTAVWSDGGRATAATGAASGWGTPSLFGSNVSTPVVAMNSGGAGVLVWGQSPSSTSEVHVVRHSALRWGADEVVSTAGQDSRGPVAAIDGSGVVTIAWVRRNPDNSQEVQAVRSTANGWTSPVTVSGIEPFAVAIRPAIATNSAGRVVLIWNGEEGGRGLMRATVHGPGGWSAPATISGTGAGEAPDMLTPFQVAVDPLGRATAAWLWATGGGFNRVLAVRLKGVPAAPTAPSAVAGDASARVTWSVPPDDGSSPITRYAVTATPGGRQCEAAATTSCTVTGLANGIAHTFTVSATNAEGTGPASVATAAVTPTRAVKVLRVKVSLAGRLVTTTGPVTAGVTRVTQRLTAPRRRARNATCRIIRPARRGAARTFRCTVRVAPARWTVRTETRDARGVVARSTRALRVR